MNYYEIKGLGFEKDLEFLVRELGRFEIFANLPLYSHKLQSATDVDLLFVLGQDLFVVEAKSYSTELIGHFEDTRWSGISGVRIYDIYNPVFQNLEHIRSLKSYLSSKKYEGYSSLRYHNCVVVPDSCKLSCDPKFVVHFSYMLQCLSQWVSYTPTDSALTDLLKGAYIQYANIRKGW